MPRKQIAGTPADPTLPRTPVALDGKEYMLCLDLNALAQAEADLSAAGHKVNILYALPELNLSSVRVLFLAGLRRFHPELSYSDVERLFSIQNVFAITEAVANAYRTSKPDPEPDPVVADAEQ